jgi:hypothetical protein
MLRTSPLVFRPTVFNFSLVFLVNVLLVRLILLVVPPPTADSEFGHGLSSSQWMFFVQASLFEARALQFSRSVANARLPPGLSFRYTFVGLLDENTTCPPNLAIPPDYLDWPKYYDARDRGLMWPIRIAAGLFYALDYALRETNARWIVRMFTDTVINFDLLVPFMQALDRKFNPLRQAVLRGDCIVCGFPFLQGGAGVIFSRYALEVLVPYAHYGIWDFWEEQDDRRLGHVMWDIGMRAAPMGSSAFTGISIIEEDWRRIESGNWSGMPVCPSEAAQAKDGCPRFVAPVSQIVFQHASPLMKWESSLAKVVERLKNLWAQPDVALWRVRGMDSVLCHMDGPPMQPGTFLFP